MNILKTPRMPSRREKWTVLGFMTLFLLCTAAFIGLRVEHLLMAGIYLVLFFSGLPGRKLAVALLPFALFGISYDWMRIWPNYEVNQIDVAGLYHLEKSLFGIMDNGVLVIPCKYFTVHHWAIADIFAGIFYLCWVPVPIAFGIWLYLTKSRSIYLRFSMVFLFVNLLGFIGYYIYPAAPPWYAINYGFEPILNTPGNVAGLGRFDELTGMNVFQSIYGRNANVFAAVPSLHAAYMVVTLAYAIIRRCKWYVITIFSVIMVGIWCTAVYSSHHYIIDVLLGVFCAIAGILIFEKGLMRLRWFRDFFDKYYNYIQ